MEAGCNYNGCAYPKKRCFEYVDGYEWSGSMMRKITDRFVVLLLAALMLWLLPADIAAADLEDRSRVDAVIIVDVSSSMNYNGAEEDSKQNAPLYDAAYDAATMFIHMCEMNGSRVAVVPFSDEVFENNAPGTGSYAWCTLRDVSDVAARDEMIRKIRSLRTDNATNLGEAMEKAYEIIRDSRADEAANQPMILLLTDGAVEIFEGGRRQNEASDASAAQAVEFARKSREELGCKLYCVGLKGKTFNGDSLYAYTDSDMIHVAENSDQLPSFFNDVFAKQIGAQILGESHISKTLNEDGTVTLTIRIPNNSILEANVILNCSEKTEDPSVRDGEGRDVTHGAGVHLFRGKSYCIVKIENPAAGNYEISYLPGTQEDINVSLITNYKVQYQIEAESVLAKNEQFAVSAYFTENGAHTSDDALYMGDMHAQIALYDEAGNRLTDCDMTAVNEKGQSHFECMLPALKTGRYQLISNVEGEGLERTSPAFWIEMVNQTPVLSGGIYEPIELKINDILTSDEPHKPVTSEVTLSDYFADADVDDPLSYEYGLEGSSVSAAIEDGRLLLTTTGEEGETVVTVCALDEDGARSENLTFTVAVQDIEAAIRNGKSLVMKTETDGLQPKGSDVRVLIGLQDQSGQWISSPAINEYLEKNQSFFWQSDAAKNVTPQALTLSFDETVGCLSGTVSTEYRAGFYAISGGIKGQEAYMTLSEGTGFEVGNAAPEAAADEKSEKMRIEPLPMNLTFGRDALVGRETVVLEMSDIFADADHEPLVYGVMDAQGAAIDQNEGVLEDESGEALAEWQLDESGCLTVTASRPGTGEIVLAARDGDGVTAEMRLNISVVSIRTWVISGALKILALALAAMLLIRILYVVLIKPGYPKKCELQVKVNSTYRTQTTLGGKKKYKLSAKIDGACCRDANLEKSELAKITIQPAMGGRILIKNKTKKKDKIELSVNGREIQAGKKDRMSLGGELRIAKAGNESYVTLVYRKKV